ncbi:MAG: hypothetical protein CML42_08330 [Rhodobacteraceae bacterium]|nr:hypothetical protein [Paracoccaceae bacterium]
MSGTILTFITSIFHLCLNVFINNLKCTSFYYLMNTPILCGFILFNIYNNFMRKCLKSIARSTATEILYDKLLENLFVPGLHCYIANVNILCYLFFQEPRSLEVAYIVSTSYYLFDTMRIINDYHYNVFDNLFLLHHMLSIGLIQYNISYYGSSYYIVAELSNIFYFPMYYCIKMNITGNIKKILAISQLVSYIFCRVFVISYIYYLSFFIDPMYSIIMGFPIYLMGIIWSYHLYMNF